MLKEISTVFAESQKKKSSPNLKVKIPYINIVKKKRLHFLRA